jgi:GxxExxY protein
MNADCLLERAPFGAPVDTLAHRELTDSILNAFYEVYNELGHGFLESVYETALAIVLTDRGLDVRREVLLDVRFRGRSVGAFRADMIVNSAVVIELKAARTLDPSHEAQILNYLRATELEVGLLLNFGPKPTFKRVAFSNTRKFIRVHPR